MYVAESKRLTHEGARKIMATAVDMADQARADRRPVYRRVGVSGGDWETDLRIAKAAVESIGMSWK